MTFFVGCVVTLGLLWAGYFVGYHLGWQDGYWAEHPPPIDQETTDA